MNEVSVAQVAHALAAVVVLGCIATVWRGVRRYCPQSVAFRVTAVGLTMMGVGHAWERLAGLVAVPSEAVLTVLYALAYAQILAGLIMLVVRRSSRSLVGRVVLLDVAAGSAAFGLVAWQVIVQPGLESASLSVVYATCFVLFDVAIATVVARLALTAPGNRTAQWFVVSVVLVWVGDLTVIVIGEVNELSRTLYLIDYVTITAAMTHPDMRRLVEPSASNARETVPGKLAITPAVVALVVALIASFVVDEPVPLTAVGLSVLTGGALVLRTRLLLRETETFSRELYDLADTDALTGLPNRRALEQHLQRVVDDPRQPAALLFVDLDRFKAVNDTYGHGAGDAVLVETARRLRGAVRAGDYVARYAGDEFVIVCEELAGEPAAMVRRIEQLLNAPIRHERDTLGIGASIGVSAIDGAGSADELLDAADRLMYEHKRRSAPSAAQPCGGERSSNGSAHDRGATGDR